MSAPSPTTKSNAATRGPGLVDCDIHNYLTPEAIARHLPQKWRDYDRQFGRRMTPA